MELVNYYSDKLLDTFKLLSSEAKDLYLDPQVREISSSVDALSFYRDWIAPNKPVIVKSAIKHWDAFQKWNSLYLREVMGLEEVTVAVTPNGYADAPLGNYFVMPEERPMKFGKFLDIIEKKQDEGIFYVQKQNSNLTDEFRLLMRDVEECSWFSDALGKKPDAVNFWMGDERAVTSTHKDNYENLYCVVRGYKDFVLLPPTDLPWVPYRLYPPAIYQKNSEGGFKVVPLDSTTAPVPWVCIDVLNPNLTEFPLYKHATPIHVRVEAGDALYLPSLWFHHVRQSHGCVSVNFWYDMEYDIKYNYFTMLQTLAWNKVPET